MLVGARHFDQHMSIQANYMGIKGSEPHQQGFIDQYVDVVLTDKMAREFIAFIEQSKAATS
jgi:hypothetical protein